MKALELMTIQVKEQNSKGVKEQRQLKIIPNRAIAQKNIPESSMGI